MSRPRRADSTGVRSPKARFGHRPSPGRIVDPGGVSTLPSCNAAAIGASPGHRAPRRSRSVTRRIGVQSPPGGCTASIALDRSTEGPNGSTRMLGTSDERQWVQLFWNLPPRASRAIRGGQIESGRFWGSIPGNHNGGCPSPRMTPIHARLGSCSPRGPDTEMARVGSSTGESR
jgi:hypothetical protein